MSLLKNRLRNQIQANQMQATILILRGNIKVYMIRSQMQVIQDEFVEE